MTKFVLIFIGLLIPIVAKSQTFAPREPGVEVRTGHGQKLLRISMGVLAAATVADAATSWNRMEANPLLQGPNGRFGAKGMSLKFALAGSTIAAQWMMSKKMPGSARTMAIANYSMSGILTGVAVHNFQTRPSRP